MKNTMIEVPQCKGGDWGASGTMRVFNVYNRPSGYQGIENGVVFTAEHVTPRHPEGFSVNGDQEKLADAMRKWPGIMVAWAKAPYKYRSVIKALLKEFSFHLLDKDSREVIAAGLLSISIEEE